MVVVATLGRPGLQPAPVSVWQRKAQIICKDQTSVGLFPSCKYITVHNAGLNGRGLGGHKIAYLSELKPITKSRLFYLEAKNNPSSPNINIHSWLYAVQTVL